jgi:L-amino acid N-acyltransferase YncA
MPSPRRTPSVIRTATALDAAQVAAIYAPSVTDSATSFELDAPGPDEMERRIVQTLERFPSLVCERDGQVLGFVRAGRFRERPAYQWSAETSAYVRGDVRRSGVARALCTAILEMLTLQGYYNAYAAIALPNLASVALHESMGFTPVGVFRSTGYKLGAWHDVGWWQRTLQPHAVSPVPPRPYPSIVGSGEWAAIVAGAVGLLRL